MALITADVEAWALGALRPAFEVREATLEIARYSRSPQAVWQTFVDHGMVPRVWTTPLASFITGKVGCSVCPGSGSLSSSDHGTMCKRCNAGVIALSESTLPPRSRDCLTLASAIPLLTTAHGLVCELRARVRVWGVHLMPRAEIVWQILDDPLGGSHEYSPWDAMLRPWLTRLRALHPDQVERNAATYSALFTHTLGYNTRNLIGQELCDYDLVAHHLQSLNPIVRSNPFEPLATLWKLGFRVAWIHPDRLVLIIPSVADDRSFRAGVPASELARPRL